jgi:dephospho-CoA kinase
MSIKIIGLSGSISSGKSFIASIFSSEKIWVFDADLVVHNLLQKIEIIKAIAVDFGEAVNNNKVDRQILGDIVFGDRQKLTKLEQTLHPQVRLEYFAFLRKAKQHKQKLIVLNVPLLLEKKQYYRCHKVIAIIADQQLRWHRFYHRKTWQNINYARQKFLAINQRQPNNFVRCKNADFILPNHFSKNIVRQKIINFITSLK